MIGFAAMREEMTFLKTLLKTKKLSKSLQEK